jgi:Type VI secretion system (T6SS), amidase effector protein 4
MRVPSSDRIYAAYRGFAGVAGQVCRRPGQDENQCAVRMSVALGLADCGFNFGGWTLGHVHSGRGRCTEGDPLPPHVTNATNLTAHLRSLGLFFEDYPTAGPGAITGARIMDRMRNRSGIVFFPRLGGNALSHIDFWNGSVIMNEELNYRARDEPPRSERYFNRATGTIQFCPTR